MENIFQSKSVPRGTRTIWRYLSAFILLFSLSIGNVWADGTALADLSFSGITAAPSAYTYSTTSTPSYQASQGPSGKKKSCMLVGNGGNGQTPTITASGPIVSEGKRWMAFCPAEDCNLVIECFGSTSKYFMLYDADHYTAKTNCTNTDTHLSIIQGTGAWATWEIEGLTAGTWYVLSANSSSTYVSSMTFTATGSASTDPVSSVSLAGAATGYATLPVELTATPDETATAYKWFVDGVEQDGQTAAKFNFTPATPGTYSIVAKARNDYNAENEWIASSAHTYTASKLCGELIKIVQNGQSDGTVSGILTGTKDVKLSSGTSEYDEKTGRKIGSDNYWLGVKELSKPLRAGDVATIFVTSTSANLILYSDKGTTKIGEKIGGVTQGANDIVLTSAATGATAIYLYRVPEATDAHGGGNMNPYVYSLSVNRSCTESTDCSIKSLTINGEAITPAEKVYNYEVAAASALTEVAVAYSIHPLATGTPASGFNVTVPAAGDPANTQTITVTAEDGTTSDTYTVSVTKAAAASDVVTLDALGVTGYTLDPAFDAGTLAYTITKAYGAEDPGTDKVTFTKTETEQTVGVAYDGTNHKLTVTVTAEDNTTTQDYVITINEAEAPKSLSRVLFSNGFDAFIDNANHTVKAYYLAGTSVPTATTITAGAGTAGELAEGKITVTGADDSTVDYIVTLEAVTPNTTTVADADPAGEFAGDEAWVKNGLLIYGNAAGYSAGDKWYVNRRLTKGTDPEDDQRVIAGWVRSYFFVGNASKFIMTVGGNNALKYAIDGGEQVANASGTLEIALAKGNHMIEIVSNQNSGDCRLSAPKLIELPPSFTVNYYPGEGSGPEFVIDYDATVVADCPVEFIAPEGKIFHGWKDALNNDMAVGDPVTADMALTAQWIAHYAVTFNLQGHGASIVAQDIVHGSKAVKPADPLAIGWEFGGWFTEAACENEFDFNTAITAATELFAKWTAFDGCTLFYPATSGSTIAVGDEIASQTGSFGATMIAVSKDENCTLAYETYGLSFASSGNTSRVKVTLDHEIMIGTKISVTLVANGDKGSNRALDLYNSAVAKKAMLGWSSSDDFAKYDVATFSHTVTAEDAMAGTNEFYLYRNNSVYLQCLKVETCGDPIVFHNVTSAVVPAGKGTVTLGAGSVRVGHTTTAEFSDIDPLYEFVSWSVSGEGASIEDASANPATITMGTEDAVVTLNLQLIPVKFTVNYYDGETLMGSELVAVNENPTASEIDTDKRHYTFQGWAETDGGSVVDLNTITRTEATTVELYAKYEPVACPTSGTIFSVEIDDTKIPASTVKVAKNGGTLDVADYATISGGKAMFINDETSDKDAISNSGQFRLVATKAVLKVELDCALQENDIIRIDNNQKWVVSTSKTKTGTYQALTSSEQEFAVTAAWAGVDDLYFLYDGSSLSFTQIEVYRRPALTGASLADLTIRQGVIKTPELTLEPSADAIVTSQAWEIVGTPVNLTGAAIDAATGAITTGTLDDASLNGTITVKVTLNGSIEATCTATVVDAVVQQNVTKSTIWNWQKTGATANIELTNSTDPKRNEAFVLANVAVNNDADFESDKLVVEGQWMVRDFDKTNPYFQGQTIKFNATVAGLVRVKFSNTGGNPARELYINGVGTGNSSANATLNWSDYVEVPAGEVSMTAFYVDPAEGTGQQYIRIAEIEFLEIMDSRTGYAAKDLGTACYEDDAIIIGAKAYEVAGVNGNGYVLFEDLGEGEALEAGKPYLFESEGSAIYFCKKIGANHADEEIEIMGMIGTFTGTTLTQGDVNYCYFSGRHLWMVNDFTVDIPVPAHRCYVNYDVLSTSVASPAPAPGRVRMAMGVVGAPKTPTSVENVQGDKVQNTKLLINGQLFILRGEKKYDATGRLVK